MALIRCIRLRFALIGVLHNIVSRLIYFRAVAARQPGIKSFDFGVMLGAGVTVRNVTVSARYDLGLANIETNAGPGQSSKNRALMIMVSLAIK
ncbi:MAG: hypothetical protein ACREK8_03325 [Gemmatimonadales bacterium]